MIWFQIQPYKNLTSNKIEQQLLLTSFETKDHDNKILVNKSEL